MYQFGVPSSTSSRHHNLARHNKASTNISLLHEGIILQEQPKAFATPQNSENSNAIIYKAVKLYVITNTANRAFLDLFGSRSAADIAANDAREVELHPGILAWQGPLRYLATLV